MSFSFGSCARAVHRHRAYIESMLCSLRCAPQAGDRMGNMRGLSGSTGIAKTRRNNLPERTIPKAVGKEANQPHSPDAALAETSRLSQNLGVQALTGRQLTAGGFVLLRRCSIQQPLRRVHSAVLGRTRSQPAGEFPAGHPASRRKSWDEILRRPRIPR